MAIAKAKIQEIRFYAPAAKKVSLAGSFNNWDAKAHAAKKDTKGNWTVKLNLKPGRYEYKFVVDGSWMNDPKCTSCVSNSFGSQNCVLDIK
jgi:1,4-alpha-glucan branching enzyme